MSLITRVLKCVMWWKDEPEQNENSSLENSLKEWSFLIIPLQRLLLWENLTHSLSFFIFINAVFWSVVHAEIRLYGIIFFLLFLLSLGDFLINQGFIESGRGSTFRWLFAEVAEEAEGSNTRTDGLLTPEELSERFRHINEIIHDLYIRNVTLRREAPFSFMVRWTGVCFILIAFGLAFSGVTIIYLLLMTILLGPAVYLQIAGYIKSVDISGQGDNELNEFLPEREEFLVQNQNPLQDAEVAPSIESGEESSLYPDLSSMPTYDQSLDYLEPDEPIPSPRQIDPEESDDSDGSIGIQLKTRHFNGDGSSTSSGEELSSGLRFRRSVPRDASSDDDFEFVSKDDLL